MPFDFDKFRAAHAADIAASAAYTPRVVHFLDRDWTIPDEMPLNVWLFTYSREAQYVMPGLKDAFGDQLPDLLASGLSLYDLAQGIIDGVLGDAYRDSTTESPEPVPNSDADGAPVPNSDGSTSPSETPTAP